MTAKQTQETEADKKSSTVVLDGKTFERRVAQMVKLSKLETGEKITGVYVASGTKNITQKTGEHAGEIKEVPFYVLNVDGARVQFLGDAGFNLAFESALVKAGDLICIEKLEKVDLGGGRRVNAYDILVAI